MSNNLRLTSDTRESDLPLTARILREGNHHMPDTSTLEAGSAARSQTVLVTGGAGFLGSRVVELIAETTDHRVIAVDVVENPRSHEIGHSRTSSSGRWISATWTLSTPWSPRPMRSCT